MDIITPIIPPEPEAPKQAVTTRFTRKPLLNPDRLHEEVRALVGDKYISMDTDAEGITIRFTGDVTSDDKDRVSALIDAHDHTQLSAPQQRVKDRVDAFTRLKGTDFTDLRGKQGAAKLDAIIDLLQDWQKLLGDTDGKLD